MLGNINIQKQTVFRSIRIHIDTGHRRIGDVLLPLFEIELKVWVRPLGNRTIDLGLPSGSGLWACSLFSSCLNCLAINVGDNRRSPAKLSSG
jgi:hypothetical protein